MRRILAGILLAGATAAAANNWGKWGPDDQLGTLNYITPEVIKKAAGLVKQGKVFSLAIPLAQEEAIWGTRQVQHFMIMTGQDTGEDPSFADDHISMPLHGTTHWDSLAHIYSEGKLYNGYDARKEITPAGVAKNSIANASNKVVTRGVLLDVARHKGVRHLEGGYEITPADLEATAGKQGVRIDRGDALLIRTGWLQMWESDPKRFKDQEPGIGWAAGQWLKQKEVALVASDNLSVEVLPPKPDSEKAINRPGFFNPLHLELIRNQGMMLGELFNLEELAEDCARDGVYEFMFVSPPLNVIGGTGSPLNPQAIR